MTLAQKIRDQRYAKGWGPDELASRASISRTALYQIESGRTEHPRAATVRRIAEALEIPVETFLGANLGIVAMGWPGPDPSSFASSKESGSPTRFRIEDVGAARRSGELNQKFLDVLDSPLGESFARIVEETHRILPRAVAEARW